jgi:hypothetical protein
MVGFRRIKTKWLVTAVMVLAVALAAGIWLHHHSALAGGRKSPRRWLRQPYFAKHAMKLREQALLKVEPQVFAPTSSRPATQRFQWKTNIVTAVFWIGGPKETDMVSVRTASAWDPNWVQDYGGLDNPESSARSSYIPVAFIPRQNPFYCATSLQRCGQRSVQTRSAVCRSLVQTSVRGAGSISVQRSLGRHSQRRSHVLCAMGRMRPVSHRSFPIRFPKRAPQAKC